MKKNNKNKNKTNNRHGRNETAEKCSYSAKTVLTISSEDKHAKMSPIIAKTKEISKIYIDIFLVLSLISHNAFYFFHSTEILHFLRTGDHWSQFTACGLHNDSEICSEQLAAGNCLRV